MQEMRVATENKGNDLNRARPDLKRKMWLKFKTIRKYGLNGLDTSLVHMDIKREGDTA